MFSNAKSFISLSCTVVATLLISCMSLIYGQQTYTHSYETEAANALLPLYQTHTPMRPLAQSSNHGDLFEHTLSNLLSYREILPHLVDDAVRSINTPITFHLQCSQGTYQQVDIHIRTNHSLNTDYQLTMEGAYAGHYLWQWKAETRGHTRVLYFNNLLQLSSHVFVNPRDDLQLIKNMALLYHELLHGQLMIDAIKHDYATQLQFCAGQPLNMQAADSEHRRVPLYEQAFMLRYAQRENDLLAMRIPAGYGRFRLYLGRLNGYSRPEQIKMNVASSGYLDNFSQVPSLRLQGNDLYMIGEIRDSQRPTNFVAMFAPAY